MDDRKLTFSQGEVTQQMREEIFGQRGIVLWFTGLSGSGKSTIAIEAERRLAGEGRHVFRLDGDNVRFGLNSDLGFSMEDRHENIRRVAHVAALMREAGLIVLVTFISPTNALRQMAREIIGQDHYREVYVKAGVDNCIARDPKGLYKKALAGQIPDFTGISSPYEAPGNPDLTLDTCAYDAAECSRQAVEYISKLTLALDPSPTSGEGSYSS